MQGDGKREAGPQQEEERQRGRVTLAMYATYIRAWGPGLILPMMFLSICICGKSLEVLDLCFLLPLFSFFLLGGPLVP